MEEYEALLLGLKLVKNLGEIRVSVIGDSDLIIQQINGECSTKDPRLREYRGTVVEILNTFLQAQLAKIPRKQNLHAHSLAMFASTCKLPFEPNHQFTAEIRQRPTIPENFPIYSVHSDMDSFILYNAEFDLPTELEVPTTEPKEIANKSSIQIQEISEENETSDT